MVRGADLDERQLVLDDVGLGQVLDLEHVDEPVELLGHLLDREVVAAQRDGHAADVGPLGVADGQRLDVEVARADEARDAVQDAGPVVDEDDQHVTA